MQYATAMQATRAKDVGASPPAVAGGGHWLTATLTSASRFSPPAVGVDDAVDDDASPDAACAAERRAAAAHGATRDDALENALENARARPSTSGRAARARRVVRAHRREVEQVCVHVAATRGDASGIARALNEKGARRRVREGETEYVTDECRLLLM